MRSSIKIFAAGCLVLTALGIQSCKKEVNSRISTSDNFSNSSIIQVYVPMVNTTANNVYIDAKQVTGATLASGGLFPSTGLGAAVDGGMRAFLLTSTTAAQPQFSFAENLQAGRKYTVFVYDTFTTPKQKTVETIIQIPTDGTARLRFANFIYNAGTLASGFDIYSVKKATVVFTNVKETEVTDFIPYTAAVTDTFYIRLNGSTTNLQNYVPPVPPATTGTFVNIQAILTPTQHRSYSLVWRGSYKGSNTTVAPAFTAANPTLRALSIITNY